MASTRILTLVGNEGHRKQLEPEMKGMVGEAQRQGALYFGAVVVAHQRFCEAAVHVATKGFQPPADLFFGLETFEQLMLVTLETCLGRRPVDVIVTASEPMDYVGGWVWCYLQAQSITGISLVSTDLPGGRYSDCFRLTPDSPNIHASAHRYALTIPARSRNELIITPPATPALYLLVPKEAAPLH